MDNYSYLQRKIQTARSIADKLGLSMQEIIIHLCSILPECDQLPIYDFIPPESQHNYQCDTIQEAITCYITYGEGDLSEIIEAIKKARHTQ